jgi:hypothetical protein
MTERAESQGSQNGSAPFIVDTILSSGQLSVVVVGGVGMWEMRSVFHISMPLLLRQDCSAGGL